MSRHLPALLLITLSPAVERAGGSTGERIYNTHCAPCHGIGGAGGRGPALTRLQRAGDDASLAELIRDGIPGTEMPRGWMLSERELADVTRYVRSLGTVAAAAVPGDPSRGAELFRAQGCAGCHIVRGVGDAWGPELTEVGARRSAAHLRESIVNPAASLPDGFMLVDAGSGRAIRIAEDPFTVQVLYPGGRIASYRKSRLSSYRKLPGESPMPAYGKLAPGDLQDLVAYLASLRGGKQ